MRILVDTNVWIDHLRKSEPVLVDLLERDQVCVHQSVITELALGNIKDRAIFLKALERLMIVRNVDDQGVRYFIQERRLWGRGAECCRCGNSGERCCNPWHVTVDTRQAPASGRARRGCARGPRLRGVEAGS